jgi:hypothetical protein
MPRTDNLLSISVMRNGKQSNLRSGRRLPKCGLVHREPTKNELFDQCAEGLRRCIFQTRATPIEGMRWFVLSSSNDATMSLKVSASSPRAAETLAKAAMPPKNVRRVGSKRPTFRGPGKCIAASPARALQPQDT